MGNSNRREYLTATVLDQDLLDRLQDNLEFQLEAIVEVERPDAGFIKASDRNKYVGSTFYEALTEFPVIKRTLGEWLNPNLEFSTLQIAISNVDGRFNSISPGGADYDGWIGRSLTVKAGLRDVSSTYSVIFDGRITDVAGAQRDTKSLIFVARDRFDSVDKKFPTEALTKANFSDLEDHLVGFILPVIYGDFQTTVDANAPIVPAYPVNGIAALTGSDLDLYISSNSLSNIDVANTSFVRGDEYHKFDSGTVTATGPNTINIKTTANGGTYDTGTAYAYEEGDLFFIRVKGKDLGSYDDNAIEQARDILKTYGGLVSGDFHSSWDSLRDRTTPTEDGILSIKSRIWVQEQQSVLQYALSLLEQVRIECFVNRDGDFQLTALHLSSLGTLDNGYEIKNWDVEMGTFSPKLDDANVWNRARAVYDFNPAANENAKSTATYKNQAAITQVGKEISKEVSFPNLYVEADVINQLKEMLKLASAYPEFIDVVLTPRSFLRELGEIITINVNIGGIVFQDVPAMIREIGYDPKGLRIPVKLWSFQLIPYTGYSPGYSGIVGGSTATITEET